MNPKWLPATLLALLLPLGCDANPNGPSAPSASSVSVTSAPEPAPDQPSAKGRKNRNILREVGKPIGP
jgi:hypothetical protein